MSVDRRRLEGYAYRASDLTLQFTQKIYENDFSLDPSRFNSVVRMWADHFQRNLAAETEDFLKGLALIPTVPENSTHDVHEKAVDYLLEGGEESKNNPHNLVNVKEMISVIEDEYVRDVSGSVAVPNLDLTTPEKIAKTYFAIVRKTLEDKIRKNRPDIFRLMYTEQKLLEESNP